MSFAMTRVQKTLLDFIAAYIAEWGISPSFDEMKDVLGLRSKSGIHRLIIALEERGQITRLPNRARSIVVADDNLFLRLPAELTSQLTIIARENHLSVTEVATRAIGHGILFKHFLVPFPIAEKTA